MPTSSRIKRTIRHSMQMDFEGDTFPKSEIMELLDPAPQTAQVKVNFTPAQFSNSPVEQDIAAHGSIVVSWEGPLSDRDFQWSPER